MLKTLTFSAKFKINHSFILLYHLKQKVKAKQEQFKNYYSFTLLLHDGQDAQEIMRRFKSDLYRADKNAFALFFEVVNRDKADTIFFTCQHKGIRHLHGLIFADKEIDISDIKNSQVRSNKLKSKDEYEVQDATLFIDYIFHKHHIFRIYHNHIKVKQPIKLAISNIISKNSSFNFSQKIQKALKNRKDSKNIVKNKAKKTSNFTVFSASAMKRPQDFFIQTYQSKAVKKYAIY